MAHALCFVAVLIAVPAPAFSQVERVSDIEVDFVRWMDGEHRLRVRILDAEGRPVPGVSGVMVEQDGHSIDQVTLVPWTEVVSEMHVTVLIDGPLVETRRGDQAAWTTLFGSLARSARSGDRLRVGVMGRNVQTTSLPLRQAGRAAEWLTSGASVGPEVYLWDALHDEVRRARAADGVVLLITRGTDDGSRRRVLDALAAATTGRRPVPILVYLVGADRHGREAERLIRLSAHVGGWLRRLGGVEDVAEAALLGLQQIRGAYGLSFVDPAWDRKVEEHTVTITLQQGSKRRWTRHLYSTADVLLRPWWQSGLVWAFGGSLLLLLGAGWWFVRPRRVCRLVVETGEERGCRYDIYDVTLTLGAAAGNDIILAESSISRSHAVLERRGKTVELVDLNSENGTFVNGDRVSRRQLTVGDRISLGGAIEFVYRT